MSPSERPTQLDKYMLHDRSLRDWHEWLTTDQQTGEYVGDLGSPGSRYGRIASECAWFALASEVIATAANGEDGDPETALDFYMGLAVNDHADLAAITVDYWYVIPRALKRQLGTLREVRGLL